MESSALCAPGNRWALSSEGAKRMALLARTGRGDALVGVALSIDRLSGFVALVGSWASDTELRAALEALTPHIERSIDLYLRHERVRSENLAATFGLDLVSVGVFLLTDGNRVAWSNQTARALLAQGDLKVVGDDLVCSEEMSGHRLLDAFRERSGKPFALPRTVGYPLLMEVHTMPRLSGEKVTGVALARDPLAPALPSVQILHDLYGLSPTEARLAIAFARAQSVSDFAREWGLSSAYVKTLSKRTLARAGVNTRVELVRLVLGATF